MKLLSHMQRFRKAWNEFSEFYKQARREYNYEGYSISTKLSDLGPHFWSEQDIKFHLSRFLNKEFGDFWVHNELSVSSHTFKNFDSETEKRERIDIVVSDPDSYQLNWREKHNIFIEVKWISKGKIFDDYAKLKKGSQEDCEKLQNQYFKERCREAVVCIIDDAPSETNITQQLCKEWEEIYKPVKVFLLHKSS